MSNSYKFTWCKAEFWLINKQAATFTHRWWSGEIWSLNNPQKNSYIHHQRIMTRMEALPCHFVNLHSVSWVYNKHTHYQEMVNLLPFPPLQTLEQKYCVMSRPIMVPAGRYQQFLPKLFLTAVLVPAAINSQLDIPLNNTCSPYILSSHNYSHLPLQCLQKYQTHLNVGHGAP